MHCLLLRHHGAAFKLGAALDVLHDGIELVEVERLRTVAEGVRGIVVRLDDQAVSTGTAAAPYHGGLLRGTGR